jgi:hypothetical protein
MCPLRQVCPFKYRILWKKWYEYEIWMTTCNIKRTWYVQKICVYCNNYLFVWFTSGNKSIYPIDHYQCHIHRYMWSNHHSNQLGPYLYWWIIILRWFHPLMNSGYSFNLYINDSCSKWAHYSIYLYLETGPSWSLLDLQLSVPHISVLVCGLFERKRACAGLS